MHLVGVTLKKQRATSKTKSCIIRRKDAVAFRLQRMSQRNAINYRGYMLSYDEWKKLKLKFELHINSLKKEIERKLRGLV